MSPDRVLDWCDHTVAGTCPTASAVPDQPLVKFRVTLRDPVPLFNPGERPMNPFLIRDIFSLPPRQHRTRVWEFEAKDEDEVRRLLDEAREQGIEQVRGFELWKIERVSTDHPLPTEVR